MNSWRLSHPRRPLLWLAAVLGGALLLALLFAQAVRATSHTATLTALSLVPVGTDVAGMPFDWSVDATPKSYEVFFYDTPGSRTDSVTVAAMSEEDYSISPPDADDKAGHQVALAVGKNVIEVEVWSEKRATVSTYTVTVTRVAASDASLKSLSVDVMNEPADDPLVPVALSPGFDSGTVMYQASVKSAVASVTVMATAMNGEAAVSVPTRSDEISEEDDEAGYDVALSVGDNDIPVVVVAPDGSSTTYRLHIARAGNTALLAATAWTVTTATGDQETLNPALALEAGSTTEYTTGVAETVAEVTVAATPADADGGAKAKITSPADADGTSEGHQVKLAVGKNPIMATVTAKDGSTKTYTLTITRTVPDVNLALTSLTLGMTAITADLGNKTRHTHTVSDSSTETFDEITVVAVPAGVIVPSDANGDLAGDQVRLRVGDTTFTITITQGDARQVHTVTVTRVAASDASLKSLSVNERAGRGSARASRTEPWIRLWHRDVPSQREERCRIGHRHGDSDE